MILSLLFAASAQAADPKAILLVLTNHGELGDTGEPTGFFLSEAAHPYEIFTETVPFLLQTAFEKAGATVETAEDFTENAVRDGRLVTGQNPASAKKTAELLLEAMGE